MEADKIKRNEDFERGFIEGYKRAAEDAASCYLLNLAGEAANMGIRIVADLLRSNAQKLEWDKDDLRCDALLKSLSEV